jgi:hypothetical protein
MSAPRTEVRRRSRRRKLALRLLRSGFLESCVKGDDLHAVRATDETTNHAVMHFQFVHETHLWVRTDAGGIEARREYEATEARSTAECDVRLPISAASKACLHVVTTNAIKHVTHVACRNNSLKHTAQVNFNAVKRRALRQVIHEMEVRTVPKRLDTAAE